MPFAYLLSGLRARLILLVLAAILPASILLLVSTLEQRQSVVERQRDGALANARLLAGNQGALVNSTGQLLEWIAQFPELQSDDAQACSRRLEQLLASSTGIRGLAVADARGQVSCAAPADPARPTFSIANRQAFIRAVRQQVFVIGDVITGNVSRRPNLTFGFPLLNANGDVKKVITIGLDVDSIQDSLRDMQLPNNGIMAVMDSEGVVLGSTPGTGAPENQPIDSNIARIVLQNQHGITETIGEDGIQRLYAYAPYLLNGRPALFALIGYPTDMLYATADMQLRRNLVVLILFAALTILAAWLAGDVMIVRRARSVMWAASQLRNGNLAARAGGPYGSGELSTLARDFDAMASRLEQRQRERDQAMSDLAASKDRYEMLVSAVSSIVWTSDTQGNLQGPMPAWEMFTGQRWPSYARGGGFHVVHPDDRKQLIDKWSHAVKSRRPVETEYRLWHAPSNQYRHVSMRGMPLLDQQNRVIEWVGIITDIHQRKQAEQDRQLLLDMSDALSQSRDERVALARLTRLLAPACADWCVAALVNDEGELLRVSEPHDDNHDGEVTQSVAGERASADVSQALASLECLRTGQVQLIEHLTPELLEQFHFEPAHQLMFVPVMSQGQPAALITLGINQPERRFDDAAAALMAEVSQRAALTIENQRLYREERDSRLRAERIADYLSRLQSVSSGLAMLSVPSIRQVSEAILDMLMRTFGASTGAISLVTEDGESLDLVCASGYTPDVTAGFERVLINVKRTAATEVARTGEPVFVHDQATYLKRYPNVALAFNRFNDHACAVAPMKLDNRVAGVIALNFDHDRDFSAEDKNLLMTLCTQVAQAIARARLFEEERQSRQRAERSAAYLSRLQLVSSVMTSLPEPSVKQLTDAALDALILCFGASTGAISVITPDGLYTQVVSVRGYPDEEIAGFERVLIADRTTAGADVAATGEPVWIRDNAEYLRRYPNSPVLYQRGDDSACAVVPMKLKQRVVGIIALNFNHARVFSAEDKDLLITLSTQCAQAMERVQLYEEARQINQQLEARVQDRTRQLETTILQLRKSREQLRELSGQLLAAVEEERKRISQEVHDELGQALTVIKMDLGFARRKLNGVAPDVAAHLIESMKHIDESIRIMRRIATDLRPEILDSLGLEAAVEWQVQEFERRTGIHCNLLKESNDKPIFDKDISIAAYRILQEALTNIARHSQATEAHITYVADDERLFIEIQDNGIGLPEQPEGNTKSLGLRGMNERARHVHGTVNVQGAPGKGTTVTLDIALSASAGESPAIA